MQVAHGAAVSELRASIVGHSQISDKNLISYRVVGEGVVPASRALLDGRKQWYRGFHPRSRKCL